MIGEDRRQSAVKDATEVMAALAVSSGYPVNDWLATALRRFRDRDGGLYACLHASTLTQAVFMLLSKPDRMVCAACWAQDKLLPDPRCDRCGHHEQELELGLVQWGSIIIAIVLCQVCNLATLTEDPA